MKSNYCSYFLPAFAALTAACSAETAATTPAEDTASDAIDTSDVIADVQTAEVDGDDTDSADTGIAEDVADASSVSPDTEDIGTTGKDTGPAKVPIAGCCDEDDDCVDDAFCSPAKSVGGEPIGQCIPSEAPSEDTCWRDQDCPSGEDCIGALFPKCGGPAPTPGTCKPPAPPCCDFSFDSCPDGACIDGFCLPGWYDGNKCLTSQDCYLIGYSCVGGEKNGGFCDSGGSAPTVGDCAADGPGGFCMAVNPGAFGDCEGVLGWAWTGGGCHEISGCECGEFCGNVFETKDECTASCSPPVCCSDEFDCPSGLQCTSGHCVLPAPEGRCYADGDCNEGQVCGAVEACYCGDKYCEDLGVNAVQPGVCLDPPECCKYIDGEFSECSAESRCIYAGFAAPRCHPAVDPGLCWTASDCKPEDYCLGAQPCSCEDAYCTPKAGACTPKTEGCCTIDAECDEGLVCTAEIALPGGSAYFGKEVGACTTPPVPGECFGDEFCADDEQCVYWSGFSCGDEGLDFIYAGKCVPRDGACCTEGFDCKDGYQCSFTLPTNGKVCKPIPDVGTCWSALDCEEGQACIGAETCGLCGPCEGAGTPGTCLGVDDPAAACCDSDDDCSEGEACTVAETPKSWSPPGVTSGQCVPSPTESGSCFGAGQCGAGDFCQGFAGHPCGMSTKAPDGYPTFYPGYCTVADGSCCFAQDDCPTGFHCAGLDTTSNSGLCKPEQDGGDCWSDLDCGGGTCEGELVCGCKGCQDEEIMGACQ